MLRTFVKVTTPCASVLFSTVTLAQNRNPSPELNQPLGMSAALSEGGVAHTSDMSSLDYNPAGIAQQRDVYLGGEFFWQGENVRGWEAGLVDNAMSALAAGLKMRQTNKVTGGLDRRFTLGIAGQVPDYPLLIGVGGDYSQSSKVDVRIDSKNKDKTENTNLRFGAILSLSPQLQLGLRSAGYLDRVDGYEHAGGLTYAFYGYYFGSADLVFRKNGPEKALLGLTIQAQTYLDLLFSYGYELRTPKHSAAGGIAVKSDNKFRLFYTIAKTDFDDKLLNHSLGAKLTFGF